MIEDFDSVVADVKNRRIIIEDESRIPWLTMLLNYHAIIDAGVIEAIAIENQSGRECACKRGCTVCCIGQTDIPVYPIELAGIYWHCAEKLADAERPELIERLTHASADAACPFLNDGSCAIYPVRPAACRQFNVFGTACVSGEDAYFTRRGDVLNPIREFVDAAMMETLPFYGVTDPIDQEEVISAGALDNHALNLRKMDWQRLAGVLKQAR